MYKLFKIGNLKTHTFAYNFIILKRFRKQIKYQLERTLTKNKTQSIWIDKATTAKQKIKEININSDPDSKTTSLYSYSLMLHAEQRSNKYQLHNLWFNPNMARIHDLIIKIWKKYRTMWIVTKTGSKTECIETTRWKGKLCIWPIRWRASIKHFVHVLHFISCECLAYFLIYSCTSIPFRVETISFPKLTVYSVSYIDLKTWIFCSFQWNI